MICRDNGHCFAAGDHPGLFGGTDGALDFRYRIIPNWLVIAGLCAGRVV